MLAAIIIVYEAHINSTLISNRITNVIFTSNHLKRNECPFPRNYPIFLDEETAEN